MLKYHYNINISVGRSHVKVSQLKEGMMLAVSSERECPVVRRQHPDRIVFFPDIFAKASLGNVKPLKQDAYYMYLGKRVLHIPDDMRLSHYGKKTMSHHEIMSERGMVYKMHGRFFKNFEPAWKEENEHSNH
jgi:hypothetical protein